MILDLNKKLTIFLMLFFVSCSKNEVINNVEKDVHDQLSTNVEITLTKKGNITAKIKSEILKKNNQSLQLELYDNVNVDLFDEDFQHKSLIKSQSAMVNEKENRIKNLIINAKEMLDGLPEHKDEWLGFRPTLPDFLPVIGPSKNYENVYYSFGHHHLGWTLGAISGKIVSGMIANENTNMDLKPYSSVRFA